MKNSILSLFAIALVASGVVFAPRAEALSLGFVTGIANKDCIELTIAELQKKYAAIPYAQVALVCFEVVKSNSTQLCKNDIKHAVKKCARDARKIGKGK